MRKTNYEMINVVSAFDRTFGDHNLGILVGFEQEVWENRILEGYREFQITDQDAIKMGTGAFTTGDQMAHWATRGFFGRLTYNYKSKYLFEANARYDGSSRFAQGEEQWGLFPSASVGYVISNEAFWESINPYVNYLKVRASYGSLGNQGVPNYLYLPIMEIVSQTNWIEGGIRDPYVLAPTLISNTLSWETAVTMNLGFDLAFLANRLTANLDLYNRVTKDMFGPSEAVPEVLGADVPQINNAELSTSGIDLVLGWRDKIGSDFGYGVRLTFGDYQSTVTKYNNPTGTLATWREGQKLGEIWGYTVEGLFQSDEEVAGHADQSYVFQNWSPGDVKLKDLNGDEVIDIGDNTESDPGDLSVIGNSSPRYNYGIILDASWKGFDFTVFFQGMGKMDRYTNSRFYWGLYTPYEYHMDYWHEDNTDAFWPKKYDYKAPEDAKVMNLVSDRYLMNLSFLRLKSLTIGYTLPVEFSRKVFIKKARIYVSGENLLLFGSSVKELFDPQTYESTSGNTFGSTHPTQRMLSFGLMITL
jgi:TonB-linked SusC/RagA family outer membrane protein